MSGTTQTHSFDDPSSGDAREQIAELRRKVEGLLADQGQNLSRAVDRAEVYAGNVADKAQHRFEDLQDRVREKPATAILIAAVAGFVLARILGR
ncbi:DUF883 family protein [Roseomonas sp. BN140053]|uniref:DUF883 family protein n=1 Tax=Roseomonas sp. BN140053 TaxID=3391898 RepID=UPI0039EC850E